MKQFRNLAQYISSKLTRDNFRLCSVQVVHSINNYQKFTKKYDKLTIHVISQCVWVLLHIRGLPTSTVVSGDVRADRRRVSLALCKENNCSSFQTICYTDTAR